MTSVKDDLPAAVAADIKGSLPEMMQAPDANSVFAGFLSAVAKDCLNAGAAMIGHIKANVRSGEEMLSISSTNDKGDVRTRTSFSDNVDVYEMTVNVIVYGVDEKTISKILETRRADLGDNTMTIFSDTGCKDPECGDPDCADKAHRLIRID